MNLHRSLLLALALALSPLALAGNPSTPGAAAASATPETSAASSASTTSAASAHSATPQDPRAAIAGKIPGVKAEDLHPSPVPGMYELMRGTDAAYVSTDGKYAILGDLYDLGANANLTEDRRRDLRLKMLAAIPESQMVIFGPTEARHTVTVFTDVDCAYCRRLHSQIAEYNRLGIRVRYVFYPRTGPNTESWTKAEQVWCSADRKDALTRAKLGQALSAKPCADNPVAREYALGRDFNLQGTPAIVLGNGDMVPGYVTPVELAQELKSVNR
jgi:thiol:disulfide interchange protein DsbC